MNNAIQVALTGMRASQLGMDVSAHNVANSSAPGYTRQQVTFAARQSLITRAGMVGGGVETGIVQRVSDRFVGRQIRESVAEKGYYANLTSRLEDIEAALNESDEEGIGQTMNDFFTSLSQAAAAPESQSARSAAVIQAKLLAAKVRDTHGQVMAVQRENRTELQYHVEVTNDTLESIAMLNGKIAGSARGGLNVSDLQDQRDALLGKLAELLGPSVTVSQDEFEVSVSLNGQSILLGASTARLQAAGSSIVFEGTATALDVQSGRLGAMLDLATTTIPAYLADLDTLAGAMITEFNAVHEAGYGLDGTTGTSLFSGTDAGTIAVDAALSANPSLLAVSATGAPGDTGGVDALLTLRNQAVIGSASIEEFHQSMVAAIGGETAASRTQSTSVETILLQLENRRDSVQGVSIDEELTSLIRFQQAYNAAAKVISLMLEVVDTTLSIGR